MAFFMGAGVDLMCTGCGGCIWRIQLISMDESNDMSMGQGGDGGGQGGGSIHTVNND